MRLALSNDSELNDGMYTAGYGPEDETCVYELTYNYGKDKYDNFKGEGYAQVAMSTEVIAASETISNSQ